LMEEASGDDLSIHEGKVRVVFHPYEIVSLRVSYPPPQRSEAMK